MIWESFQQRPDIDKYTAIKSLSNDLAERAIAFLKEEANKEKKRAGGKREFENLVFHRGTVGYMGRRTAAAVILIQVLLLEKRLSEAWIIVSAYDAPDELLENIAKASEKTHPQESAVAYETLIVRFITKGNGPSYKKTVKLISRLKTLRGSEAYAAYISSLAEKYKTKRNFIKLLKQAS
ncbi:MAG: hypothetical protein ACT4OY_04190 [Alphaproteobacteria bacterium]